MDKVYMEEALKKLSEGIDFIEDIEFMYSVLKRRDGINEQAYIAVESGLRNARLLVADDCLRWFRFICPLVKAYGRDNDNSPIKSVEEVFDHGDIKSVHKLCYHASVVVNGEQDTDSLDDTDYMDEDYEDYEDYDYC